MRPGREPPSRVRALACSARRGAGPRLMIPPRLRRRATPPPLIARRRAAWSARGASRACMAAAVIVSARAAVPRTLVSTTCMASLSRSGVSFGLFCMNVLVIFLACNLMFWIKGILPIAHAGEDHWKHKTDVLKVRRSRVLPRSVFGASFFCLPSSVSRLPFFVFRLPSSVFQLPSSAS